MYRALVFDIGNTLVKTVDLIESTYLEVFARHSIPAEKIKLFKQFAGRPKNFLFEEALTGGFWMKNTLIPLSIAFADGDGTILRILDMEPCEADPCEIYDPGVTYSSALEVNQGAFASWGVEEGDLLTLEQ